MSFPIDATIPSAPNDPADDQPIMQQNYANIKGFLAVDHTAAGTVGAGLHNQVTYRLNQAAPGFGVGVGVLYSNLASGQAWPFWQNALGSFQLAGLSSTFSGNGFTTLPGGLIIQWGTVNNPGAGPTGVAFPLNPFPNSIFSVQLCPRNDGGHSAFTYYLDGAPTTAGFTYRGTTSGSQTLFWMALGR